MSVYDQLIIDAPVGPDEITYKFVRGKGWIAGYWKEEDKRLAGFIAEMLPEDGLTNEWFATPMTGRIPL